MSSRDMDDYCNKRRGNEEPTSLRRALDGIVYIRESNDITTELSKQPSGQHDLHPKDEEIITENYSQIDDDVNIAKVPRALDETEYTMETNDITTKLSSQPSYMTSSERHYLHPRDEAIIIENCSGKDDDVDNAKALRDWNNLEKLADLPEEKFFMNENSSGQNDQPIEKEGETVTNAYCFDRKNATHKRKRNTEQDSSSTTDGDEDEEDCPSKKQCLLKLNEERDSHPPSKK